MTLTTAPDLVAGSYVQIAGPKYPLGISLCNLTIAHASVATTLDWTWCDSTNFTVASESFYIPSQASAAWTGNQKVLSRLWPKQCYTGIEYSIADPRQTRCSSVSPTSFVFQRRSTMLTSQKNFTTTELFTLAKSGEQLTLTMLGVEPPINDTLVFAPLPPSPRPSPPPPLPPNDYFLTLDDEASSPPPPLELAPSPSPSPTPPLWPRGGLASTWYSLALVDEWKLTDDGLYDNVLAISLQGLANRHQASLYLEYPKDWAYGYTAKVREWVATSRQSNYTMLASLSEALKTFRGVPKGYVLWDPDGTTSARGTHNSARGSLLIAMTAAGQLGALVATSKHEPTLKALGLSRLEEYDFHQFRNMSDAQLHVYSKDRYWAKARKAEVMWMGGECNDQVRPAQADVAISKGMFFTDLSTLLEVPWSEENQYADALLKEASDACEASGGPPLIALGWHSYCKDYEHTFITMVSKHGGRNHGLNTNPNLSFMSQLPLPKGWRFQNRPPPKESHEVEVEEEVEGEAATAAPPPRPPAPPPVPMVFVQTDGLGLGAWTKPGRGSIPYAWEVTLPDLEIQPAILQMFYEQANTVNDTFIACLSGPGYLYPKAVPPSKLPSLLRLAGQSMRTLDLHAMVTFDASSAGTNSHTVTGDCTLSPAVVQAYTDHLPEAKVVLNGYGPTFTFASSRRPPSPATGGLPTNFSTVSFDYYLDPGGTVESIAEDLLTLSKINDAKPYLLGVHVREWSTVGRVAQVLDKLPKSFALLPLHEWIPIANRYPTFRPRYR